MLLKHVCVGPHSSLGWITGNVERSEAPRVPISWLGVRRSNRLREGVLSPVSYGRVASPAIFGRKSAPSGLFAPPHRKLTRPHFYRGIAPHMHNAAAF